MEGEDRLQPRLRCPRCQSMDTKFSYFNNYNKSQPRHFCKTCKRYWTHGGTLRNIPIGGGVRKVRRYNSASFATSSGSLGEIFRVAISSPPLIVGSGAGGLNNFSGGRFQLATQYLSHRQPPANNPGQLVFTRVNHLSLLGGQRNGLNPYIVNPFGQAQRQSRRYPISQMYQVPILPNGGTSLWNRPIVTAPAFATATTNNLPRAPNVVMNWANSGSIIGGTSNSSSIGWFRQLPGYGPFP